MRRRLSLLIVLASILPAHSQEQKIVMWGTAPNFSIIYHDGVPWEKYEDGLVRIIVLPPTEDSGSRRVYKVKLAITNRKKEDIDVDPARFIALSSDPKDSMMMWVDGGQIIAKEERKADRRRRTAAGFAGFAAGAGAQTATIQNSDGSTSTVQYHDPSAADRVIAGSHARANEIQNRFAALDAHVLRRNTISSGNFAAGDVYFEGPKQMDKKATIAELDVSVDGTIYQFRWDKGIPLPLGKHD
jgi:hypothetical protein